MSEMSIRVAMLDDVSELVRLRTDAEQWLASRGIAQWRLGKFPVTAFVARVERGEMYVRPEPDHLGGALQFTWTDPEIWDDDGVRAGYVHGLVIDRRHAGAGYGTALLAWAMDRARTAGCDYLRLDCVETNATLRDYYRALGFVEVGRHDPADGVRWNPVVLLQKPLN